MGQLLTIDAGFEHPPGIPDMSEEVVMTAKKLLAEARISTKNQISIPSAVRKFLDVGTSDRLAFQVEGDRVFMSRVDESSVEDDPVFNSFLGFIEQDIANNPQHLVPVTQAMKDDMDAFFEGVEVDIDLDAPLEEDE